MTHTDLPPMPIDGAQPQTEYYRECLDVLDTYVRRLLALAQHTQACQVYVHRECDCGLTRDRAFIEKEIEK
jgi:hypothetical protein